MESILYIVNPISGIKKKKDLQQIIKNETDKGRFDVSIKHTEYAGHAKVLAKQAVEDKINIVVAVGGDGTINEVSSQLVNCDTVLGIVPRGSGNGLARYLKIPMDDHMAVMTINKMNILTIDSIKLNHFFCINVAGIGFDAHIAHLFADYGKRGFGSYAKLIYKEYKKYKSKNYRLIIDKRNIDIDAFSISFANSSQFGNNAHIAPLAKINDGLIDVCSIKDFPAYNAVGLIFRLYAKSLPKSKFYSLHKAKHIEIKSDSRLLGHIDGEPIDFGNSLEINILPKSLKVICPFAGPKP